VEQVSDPYTDTEVCIRRLVDQHARTPRLILAVDFDDTIFDFHKKGHQYDRAITAVRAAQNAGFYIIIFTASRPDRYDFIRSHCESIDIFPDTINRNAIESPFGNEGKIFYNIFLDDRAGLGQSLDILEGLLSRI
jgi:hypothetical protein